MSWYLVCVANAALLVSLTLTWIVRRLARRHGWMAGPRSVRHVHRLPTPRIGGVAIFLSLVVCALAIGRRAEGRALTLAAIPAGWMVAVGLVDDLMGVKASRKLAAQAIGGVMLFVLGVRVPAYWIPAEVGAVVSLGLTVAWAVVVMNAVNLVDGLDGLASGSTACSTVAFTLVALAFGCSDVAVLAAALAGGVIGFLRFNRHPATIFLGDSGSLGVGAVLAAISIRLMQQSKLGVVVSVLALAHPLAEASMSTLRRALTATPVFKADRRHFHHRLLDRPLTHLTSVRVLVFLSFLFSALAVLAAKGGLHTALAVTMALIVGWYGMQSFRYDEFRYLKNVGRKVWNHRFAIDAHVQLWELRERLEECESVRDLKNELAIAFAGIGFVDARLEVPELGGAPRSVGSGRGMELAFPLVGRRGEVGVLRLTWDLATTAPPLDLDVFQEEFLPALTQVVAGHLQRHEEASIVFPRKALRPMLITERIPQSTDLNPVH